MELQIICCHMTSDLNANKDLFLIKNLELVIVLKMCVNIFIKLLII